MLALLPPMLFGAALLIALTVLVHTIVRDGARVVAVLRGDVSPATIAPLNRPAIRGARINSRRNRLPLLREAA